MKLQKAFFLFLPLFILSCSSNSDSNQMETENQSNPIVNASCPGGTYSSENGISIGFTTQADLEEFALNGYTQINGQLVISNGVSDLSVLSCLEKLDQLTLRSQNLVDLRGLENLTEIGEFRVLGSGLKNFVGLNSLRKLDALIVSGNEDLENFEGLASLESATLISISQNASLESLDGLDNLTTIQLEVGSGTSISESISINFNPSLKSISGLQNITGYMNGMNLSGNSLLEDLGRFDKLTGINALVITDCDAITNINSFPNLNEMFALIVSECSNLQFVDFPSLSRIGFFSIVNCTSFNSLLGFSSITEAYVNEDLVESVKLRGLPSLESLDGLENLANTQGSVEIDPGSLGTNSLTDACALRTLVENYLNQGVNIAYDNHIEITTACNVIDGQLLFDFENLCECN